MQLNFPIPNIQIKEVANLPATQEPLYSTSRFMVNEDDLTIVVDGVAKYRVQDGDKVSLQVYPEADQQSVQLFLNGSVFGAVLHQKRIIPLHGSSFIYNNKGVVICGDSGVGKSSITAAFCQNGATFINDDITPIVFEGTQILIKSIRTSIKLWEDSLQTLGIENDNLQKIRPSLTKYYIPIDSIKNDVPLEKLVILNQHHESEFEVVVPSGMNKYNLLRKNIYRKMYLRGMPQAAKHHFQQLLQMSEKIDLIAINRPSNSSIVETTEFIRKQL